MSEESGLSLEGRKFLILQCGSFNPPHYLHLRLFEMARDHLTERGASVVGGVMSPVSDLYGKHGLLPFTHRAEMCRRSVEDSDWLTVDDWEGRQPTYTTTRKVLEHFQDDLRRRSACPAGQRLAAPILVCGADLLDSFNTPGLWDPDDMKVILGKYGIVCIERQGTDTAKIIAQSPILAPYRKNIFLVPPTVTNDVSSTAIRKCVKDGKSIKYLMPDPVIAYIKQRSLYLS